MANYNKVILVGNLTRDPQLSYLPNQAQTPVCEIGLAINRRWRGQDGEQRESTCFIDCRTFGKQAETINKYMSKGQPILIEGRLDFDTWEKDGQRHSKHRVTVERFQFLGGRSGGDAPAPAPRQPAAAAAPAPRQPAAAAPPPREEEPVPEDYQQGGEDIPF